MHALDFVMRHDASSIACRRMCIFGPSRKDLPAWRYIDNEAIVMNQWVEFNDLKASGLGITAEKGPVSCGGT
jgi:hypothetical protein